jgi:DNA-binding NarL/FixJ family response regulator
MAAQGGALGAPEIRAEAPLSRRERDVLRLLLRGRVLKEVAQALGVSTNTANTYRCRLYDKLGVHDRAELYAAALREGLVDVARIAAEAQVDEGTVRRVLAAAVR